MKKAWQRQSNWVNEELLFSHGLQISRKLRRICCWEGKILRVFSPLPRPDSNGFFLYRLRSVYNIYLKVYNGEVNVFLLISTIALFQASLSRNTWRKPQTRYDCGLTTRQLFSDEISLILPLKLSTRSLPSGPVCFTLRRYQPLSARWWQTLRRVRRSFQWDSLIANVIYQMN